MIADRLAYVALVVADPTAAAEMLERDFGLPRREVRHGRAGVPVLSIGASALALFRPDDPFVAEHPGAGPARPGVHHIALAVADPDGAARTAREEGVGALTDSVAEGLGGGERVLLDPEATGRVRVALATPLPGAAGPPAAGPVERLDHLGIASRDNEEALAVFVNRLGLAMESTQTDVETHIAYETFTSDRYGVVHHVRPPEVVGGLRDVFVTVGDCELEFLQELDRHGAPRVLGGQPGSEPGNTGQDDGAIAGHISRRGAGLHHLAFKVADIDAELARLAQAGHAVIDPVGRPGGRRSRIGFIHPRTTAGVLLHLVQRDADWPRRQR
jgi:4-hydroxyphenylpyruvate dioxygenase-like putative hemolysin